ncbi:NUDIX hydrolase [Magnetospira sp. QH-2]|uniref:NUDIX hydrolase n=1 Tax=Magnetospira sp. (strain QH-2) TaxID=1288970 RepID=UPI0003E81185|nr:NUDIX hydrolase [Magnetospira sp. QH-2]CCQ73117.1 protein of unknown function [Magnetospira sp. QH-2]
MSNDVIPQSAVVAFRAGRDGPEVLLITSRDTGRWVLPKGNIKSGLSAAKSAAEEAFEEAGIFGKVMTPSVGRYKYSKSGGNGRVTCKVEVFLMAVNRIKNDWPEKSERKRKWMTIPKAAQMVHERKLSSLLHRVASRIEAKTQSKAA